MIEDESVSRWEFENALPADTDRMNPGSYNDNATGGATDPAAIGHAAHTHQFQDLVDAIRAGCAPQVDGREGKKSVDIVSAIYRSARENRPVPLES